jgi:signal transduction histidine kinase
MHAARQLLSIGLFGLILATLTQTAGGKGGTPAAPNSTTATVWEGTVTLVDTNRDLVVLQQGDHPMALRLDSLTQPLRVGDRIQIEGKVSPYFTAFPDYPDRPSGREIATSFEAPTDWAKHYLTRMRGFLRPPVDGNYTFWIAADDEAELFFSASEEMTNTREIAFAPRATWPREWERYPQQKSEEIFLKAGETYYIEAIQRQWRGHDCLAVAWQGPGIKQGVIDGQYLSPDQGFSAGATHGILREYWTNFFLTTLAMLVPEPHEQSASISQPRIKMLETGSLPQAGLIHIGEPWDASHNFQWVEVEGRSVFAANNAGALTLELTNVDGRMTAHIFNWGTNSTVSLENRKVRLRGVCENVTSEKGESVAGTLWVPDAQQVSLLDFTDKEWNGLEPVPMFDLTPSNPNLAWGRKVLVRGTVLERKENSELLSVQGDDSFYGYISDDGTNWEQVGVPVSIAISNSVYVGLMVSSMANYPLPTATFVRGNGSLETTRIPSASVPTPRGGVQYSNATFTIEASSGGIDDTTEKCNFVFESLSAEGEIVARVKSFQGTHVSDKAGVMMRESLESDSPSVSLMITPESKIRLQYQTPGDISRAVALVLNKTPQWLKLVRRRHLLTVLPRQNEEVPPHQPVEVVGNLTWQNKLPVLTEAYLRPILNSSSDVEKLPPSSKPQYIRIKDLPPESEEGLQYASRSFRIRGVVTFSDRVFNRNLIFVQDDSGGTLVRVLPELIQYKPLEAGQFIEAEGSIKFARGAPPFGVGSATVLGLGQMPRPLPYPDRSVAADAEGQWVEAEGVVRSIQDDGTVLLMEKDGAVKTWLKGATSDTLKHYVDALVQVRGVYSGHIQSRPVLLVPSLDYLQVKESPPEDPFLIPSFLINQVAVQEVNPQILHRLKITGVVTYRDENLLFVQDDTGSVQILTSAPNTAKVGDRVQIVGFPEKRSDSVTLTEAIVRQVGAGQPPAPSKLSAADITEGRYNGSVVRLEAIVLGQKIRDGQQLLELQLGQRVFQAILATNVGRLKSFPAGSRVQITGVNRVQFADHINAKTSQPDNSMPATLDVLLRGPADVVLIQRPPWWNWKYSAGVSALGVVVIAISIIWIRTLRRRVEERTRELKATMARLQKESETSATLVERDRLAGEIHDSLEQGLNGIMMQLDGVDSKLSEDSNGARHYLEMARNMVRFSRAEVRHSLWNLESELLANGDLGAALTEIARQMSSSDRVQVAIQVSGPASQLPPATEHHLLRICQEALNNALKHAGAKTIQITLNYSEKLVRLSIADDGCGFAPDSVLTGTGTHLGLRNLRSRARKIKGRLEVISQPAKGTTIEVSVPITAPAELVVHQNGHSI